MRFHSISWCVGTDRSNIQAPAGMIRRVVQFNSCAEIASFSEAMYQPRC